MNIDRLFNSEIGKFIISFLIGFGLATIIHSAFLNKNNIEFNGPIIPDMNNHIFKYDNKCYKYNTKQTNCLNSKTIINVSEPPNNVLPIRQEIDFIDNGINKFQTMFGIKK